jgi:hypothetical protein
MSVRLPITPSPHHPITLILVATIALLTGTGAALAWQAQSADEELASRFAPIIVLQQQNEPCDADGEPFLPAPVDVVFDDDAVILREGPQQEPAKSPFENTDLYALPDDYATDFPGSPRTPGCDYETHFKSVMGDQRPVIYAHVATEEGRRGIALQYWFFYYFNEFNNLHEGDWEMIQLLFDANTAEEALAQEPIAVAFAQHSGGEAADWDAPKLEKEGVRPVVYASRGSHASYYGPGLWLGWGQDGSGLGCDVTNNDPVRIDPEVRLIPDTIASADDPFAWVTFSGHWGERETWVYDGPTGPAFKKQWTAPVTWMEGLRADSIRVNATGLAGPVPSEIFCSVVEDASALLTLFKPYPLLVIAVVAGLLGLAVWALRQSWQNLGQTWRVYRAHFRVLAGIGAITLPLALAMSAFQYLLATNAGFAAATGISEDGETMQGILGVVSLLTRGLLFLIVTPAVIYATAEFAAGRRPGIRQSLREGFTRIPQLVWTFVRGGVVVLLLTITIIGIPWAVNRSIRWMFGSQAAVLTGERGKTALDASSQAVQGRWWQAAANGAVLAFLGATPGVAIALLLLVLARFPVDAANSVASVIYALAQPFAIAGLTLLFLRWREAPSVESRKSKVESETVSAGGEAPPVWPPVTAPG